ncbi:MAG TPA: DUF4303 domain-containing protein [Pirellulaceae bacterium]|jgi:hypothetical protein|nr:DUF4303 domain-containing protein [Pirellulaceae bacterium]
MMNADWLVFQKQDSQNRPTEFAELLVHDAGLWRRHGNVNTWGDSEKRSLGDATDSEALAAERQALEQEGFRVVREWRFDASAFDFALLRRELEIAVEATVADLRRKHPGFNAFVLTTDGSRMTIGPISHAFESLADADDESLWIPAEWSIWPSGESFDIVYRLILSQHRDDLSLVAFEDYIDGFRDAVVGALEAVDAKGLFGPREARLLSFDLGDEGQDEDAMRRLNSPELFARWKAWA